MSFAVCLFQVANGILFLEKYKNITVRVLGLRLSLRLVVDICHSGVSADRSIAAVRPMH